MLLHQIRSVLTFFMWHEKNIYYHGTCTAVNHDFCMCENKYAHMPILCQCVLQCETYGVTLSHWWSDAVYCIQRVIPKSLSTWLRGLALDLFFRHPRLHLDTFLSINSFFLQNEKSEAAYKPNCDISQIIIQAGLV